MVVHGLHGKSFAFAKALFTSLDDSTFKHNKNLESGYEEIFCQEKRPYNRSIVPPKTKEEFNINKRKVVTFYPSLYIKNILNEKKE